MPCWVEPTVNTETRRAWEKRVVSEMIAIYCRGKHHTGRGKLCPECRLLQTYALQRTEHCPFMAAKTTCARCSVHCYNPKMRRGIRVVMRYSGPRMFFYHPVMALRHLLIMRQG